MSDFPALKDQINIQLITHMADRIEAIYPSFTRGNFINAIDADLHDLELKARFALIADTLRASLPKHYPAAIQILVDALQGDPHTTNALSDADLQLLSIPTFIERHGLNDFEASMNAIYQVTCYTTCEFAIRPFIIRYPEQTLARLHHWVADDNEHVRRLVSEGTRPRLPWASQLQQFIADPSPTLALLQHLKHDPSQYVRRSVANHLNDISKDHPELVMATLETWQSDASPRTQWITNHALRTLIKKGNPRALSILGYGHADITLGAIDIAPQQLIFGKSLTLSFTIHNNSDQQQHLMIDYIMHFIKANGKPAPKVFKLKKTIIKPNERQSIQKTHRIRPVSTRKYYAGLHRIELQINGAIIGEAQFELVMPNTREE